MSALDLAYLRATGARPIADPASLDHAASLIGRTPRRAGREVTLSRHPEAPSPFDIDVVAATLTDSALVALGLCIGAAWEEADGHPYPGRPFTMDDLAGAARAMGVSTGSWNHLLSALRHSLTESRYVKIDTDGTVRLGPAVARWLESDIEVFRRNHDAFAASAGDAP